VVASATAGIGAGAVASVGVSDISGAAGTLYKKQFGKYLNLEIFTASKGVSACYLFRKFLFSNIQETSTSSFKENFPPIIST
jgi:hypothetical protein